MVATISTHQEGEWSLVCRIIHINLLNMLPVFLLPFFSSYPFELFDPICSLMINLESIFWGVFLGLKNTSSFPYILNSV